MKTLSIILLSNLLIASSVTAAETEHSATRKEVKQTTINGSTGEASQTKEGRAAMESKEVRRTADGKVQSKTTKEESATTHLDSAHGKRVQENTRTKDSTKVEADVDGDVNVKKETEHSHTHSAH